MNNRVPSESSTINNLVTNWGLRVLMIAYGVMWAGGVGHYVLIGRPPLDAPWAASLFLLLAGMIVILTARRSEVAGLLAAAGIGFLAEILGVRYGFIFSPYRYTDVLIPHLLDVPVVMLSAWMVLVAYAGHLFLPFRLNRATAAILSAGWMTAIDLVIDPLAANQLQYWRWVETGRYYGVPLHNFIGWFVVSLIIFLVIPRPRSENRLSLIVGVSIVLFFSAVALSQQVWIAGGIGIGLVAIHILLGRAASRSL
jgi:bisanhydrobacterioruberin hydratase